MVRSSRQQDFLQFRQQFPFFVFEKQEYTLDERGLSITFTFNLSDKYVFHPALFIPRKGFFLQDEEILGNLDNIVFNLGMIEMVSYWKATCPPVVIICPFSLDKEQVAWWKKLYFKGLGEFFYLNEIDIREDNFMEFDIRGIQHAKQVKPVEKWHGYASLSEVIIPVGGGKDSVVTLELLGGRPGCIPLIVNPRGASLETIAAKGFSREQLLEVKRTIDPELLKLNELGFLNGHTPFSAMLAFVTVLSAILTGYRHIALSNESSASEVTIEGTDINHQYSKSLLFESDFREYVKQWISPDINYFSFLRPLSELQIASLFSQFSQYHPVFKSCNAGSKTDTWCGHCAKCLFTYIILSPFLTRLQLVKIFNKDMFADESLKPLFDQLTGIAEEKPFDCIGTIREVNVALCETIRRYKGCDMPNLLDYYMHSQTFTIYNKVDFRSELSQYSGKHYLLPEFFNVLGLS